MTAQKRGKCLESNGATYPNRTDDLRFTKDSGHPGYADGNWGEDRSGVNGFTSANCNPLEPLVRSRKLRIDGYVGVNLNKNTGRWAANIAVNGRILHLGYFDTAVDAARERDRRALELRGARARLNFPAEPETPPGARAVQLTRGMWALVDEADYASISRWKWQATRGGNGGWYARRASYEDDRVGIVEYIRMHREIVAAAADQHVDHRNGNGLDNRRQSIRVCTSSQNGCNRGLPSQNTSGLKGVCVEKRSGKWRSTIVVAGKQHHLGLFESALDAAMAYDLAALRLHGDFARTNASMGLLDALTTSSAEEAVENKVDESMWQEGGV